MDLTCSSLNKPLWWVYMYKAMFSTYICTLIVCWQNRPFFFYMRVACHPDIWKITAAWLAKPIMRMYVSILKHLSYCMCVWLCERCDLVVHCVGIVQVVSCSICQCCLPWLQFSHQWCHHQITPGTNNINSLAMILHGYSVSCMIDFLWSIRTCKWYCTCGSELLGPMVA